MKVNLLLAVFASSAGLLGGCSDPADKVAKADTSNSTNATVSVAANAREYLFQSDSKIEFTGSKVTGKHDGGFRTFDGRLSVLNGKIVGSEVTIDMTSIWSDNDRLTGHLKSEDFFDVEKFPASSFTVTSIEGEGDNAKVTGNLELHGVTKTITFPAQIHVTDQAVHVKAEFAINRKEFGIVYPGKTDDLIRDDVVIRFDLKAVPPRG